MPGFHHESVGSSVLTGMREEGVDVLAEKVEVFRAGAAAEAFAHRGDVGAETDFLAFQFLLQGSEVHLVDTATVHHLRSEGEGGDVALIVHAETARARRAEQDLIILVVGLFGHYFNAVRKGVFGSAHFGKLALADDTAFLEGFFLNDFLLFVGIYIRFYIGKGFVFHNCQNLGFGGNFHALFFGSHHHHHEVFIHNPLLGEGIHLIQSDLCKIFLGIVEFALGTRDGFLMQVVIYILSSEAS